MCPLASNSILSKFISFANDAANKMALLSYLDLIIYMVSTQKLRFYTHAVQ